VVRLLAWGYGTKQIAVALRISHNTVRTRVRNAMSKTDAHTSAQYVAIADSPSTPMVGAAHRLAHLAPDQLEVTTDGIAR
jgi:hypothetical protein